MYCRIAFIIPVSSMHQIGQLPATNVICIDKTTRPLLDLRVIIVRTYSIHCDISGWELAGFLRIGNWCYKGDCTVYYKKRLFLYYIGVIKAILQYITKKVVPVLYSCEKCVSPLFLIYCYFSYSCVMSTDLGIFSA